VSWRNEQHDLDFDEHFDDDVYVPTDSIAMRHRRRF
jgi:hypothetical protein